MELDTPTIAPDLPVIFENAKDSFSARNPA
jgi:hypothetical protein